MKIINNNDAAFASLWNRLLANCVNVSWRYLPFWVKYQKEYCRKNFLQDLSFVVVENNQPVAACPLFLEKNSTTTNQFSYAFGYLTTPLILNKLDKKTASHIEKYCYEQIDWLASNYNSAKIMLCNDASYSDWQYNHLLKYGFLDTSLATLIIDLTQPTKNLWANLRSSYKNIINKAYKHFSVVIADYNDPDQGFHDQYRNLHHKAAGRITRSAETFALQNQMLQSDQAAIIGLRYLDKVAAISYFFHHDRRVYYASAADDPEYDYPVPLEHLIIWEAIKYYQKRRFYSLEMGLQQFGEQLFDHPDTKDLNISFFKRGFGGNLTTLYCGIKYYNRDLLKNELKYNIRLLQENYENKLTVLSF